MLFSTDAFQFTLQLIANFPKSRWLTIFLKVANVLGLKLTSYYNININISVQDMTNHETNLRNHVLWHLKLFSGRKIVERGKRKLKKVLSVTKHGFVFWQHLSYELIQALKTGQEPGLLAPVDLASLSQVKVPINQKVSTFPKKSLETIQRSVPFNQRGSTSDNMKTECSCLEKSTQTMCFGSCLCSPCRIKHPNEAKKCYCPSLCR